ncbi:phage major capsid protein [Agrobacterium pusense]|uniref:phage major capsid protein n=1 Tax=Agrobacterium pusense TaxID=648995 RepID=UPI00345E1453
MKKAAYVFATVAAIVCFGLAFTILSADPSHAASLIGHDAFVQTRGMLDHVYQATPALLALRAKATDLTTRAESKRAELVEGLSDEAARAIEKDHSAILAELDGVRAEITALENAERNAPTPADNNPQAIAQNAVRAERERVTAIEELAERAGQAGFGRDHIRSGTSLDTFRGLLLDHMVTSERATPTDSRVRVQVGNDEADTIRSARVEALAYGLGAPVPQAGPSAAARQYMGQGLVDIAADCVNFHGRRMLNARDIDNIFSRAAHSTSDFPVIFEGAVNRTLEQRYALAQPTFKRFARKKNFRDFRPDTIVKTGDFPMLEKILENGKIKFGSFGEGKEAVQAFSYAIALNISRQMLINDDLGAIAELLTSYGASVALFEEVTFYGGAYNGKLADGKTVFHAEHKNLAAAGSAITVDSVGEGRKSMGRQTSLDGKPLLANPARIMLVGPNQLTDAEKLLASITPATVSTVNIFSGKFELVETSQIADNSWDLFADPSTGSNYRWGYLEGYEAPRVRMDEPFGSQGFSMSVEHDFGCGATDFRFGYHNPGQA